VTDSSSTAKALPERRQDIAHVGPVELFTPTLDESRDFFVNLLALREVRRDGDSIYLHTWDDYQSWTLKLTKRKDAGIGRTFLRAYSPAAFERLVALIEATGLGTGYLEREPGIDHAYAFDDPDGHPMALYWSVDRYSPDDTDRPSLKNQAARFPGRGANVRRLDHVNYLTGDVPAVTEFLSETLGARCTERIANDDGGYSGVWYSVCNKSYDLVYTQDWLGAHGRLHHLAFATDTREDILRAADVFLEAGIHIESGPHKHAIQQTFFLYVYEPGGNRIELCNAGARLILAPDWEPITWTAAERAKGQAWGMKTIESFHTHGTPVIDGT
jgi:catechol 2,3-dioxygenase